MALVATIFLIVMTGIVFYFWVKSVPNQSKNQRSTSTASQTSQDKSDQSKDTDETTNTEEEIVEQPVSETCLVPSDAHDFFGVDEQYLPKDVKSYFYSETIYFNADSAEYSSPDAAKIRYDKMAEFYNKYSKKVFLYYIQATTYEDNTSSEGLRIAQARADRAKQELTSRGIPASYISVDQARTSTYNAEAMRNVVVTIKGSSDC